MFDYQTIRQQVADYTAGRHHIFETNAIMRDLRDAYPDLRDIDEVDAGEFAGIVQRHDLDRVEDADGRAVSFGAAVSLMDDEIREELHGEMAPCPNQEFFDAYCRRHEQEFGEAFTVN